MTAKRNKPKATIDRIRQERQDSLRELLSKQKHVEKVVDNIIKIESINCKPTNGEGEIDYKAMQSAKFEIDALKIANEQRLKLINKYLPDMKSVEHVGDAGGSIVIKVAEFKE